MRFLRNSGETGQRKARWDAGGLFALTDGFRSLKNELSFFQTFGLSEFQMSFFRELQFPDFQMSFFPGFRFPQNSNEIFLGFRNAQFSNEIFLDFAFFQDGQNHHGLRDLSPSLKFCASPDLSPHLLQPEQTRQLPTFQSSQRRDFLQPNKKPAKDFSLTGIFLS